MPCTWCATAYRHWIFCTQGLHTDAPHPGLILLDLNLPGYDGRQVLAQLQPPRLPQFAEVIRRIDHFLLRVVRLPGISDPAPRDEHGRGNVRRVEDRYVCTRYLLWYHRASHREGLGYRVEISPSA
jgi:hypothetical protein